MALDREQVAAWVQRSCAAQGVPVRVSDPQAVDQVVVLLVGRAGPRQRAAAREPASPPVTDATRA